MDAPERFEQLLAFLASNLPAPVVEEGGRGGAVVFTAGEPAEVVVEVTAASVIVSEFAGTWTERDALQPRPRRVGVLHWKRLPETPLFNALAALIRGAAQARRARYRKCERCEALTPPEWMFSDEVCHLCAKPAQVVH